MRRRRVIKAELYQLVEKPGAIAGLFLFAWRSRCCRKHLGINVLHACLTWRDKGALLRKRVCTNQRTEKYARLP